ncbi:uncharacterized protein [Nicotiana tomentosiformis]|uniref:uncharacterized protein n=1 Tax=Nicotiana tomentosiformis TaxID=4098 RepID=UPI00051BBEA3|nr:uncharacterized protein LOC104089232 isoform X1 [Nicotiana tomentosiformis]
MSDLSVNAHEIQYARRCHCGLIALYLTTWSDANAGRRFYKCPRSKVSSCWYFEWIDEELLRQAVMVIKDLKTKLDAAKLERNNLRNKVYLMEQATTVQRGSKNLFDEMEDVMTVERHTLKMKLDEIEQFQVVEAEKASNLEVKVKKIRNIILVSWALLFALVVVGMMK